MHPGGGLMSLRLLIALLSVLLIGIFSTQNHKLVVISFLAWEWMLSLALVIIASAVLGALFVGALGLIRQFHSGRRLRALQKQLQQAEAQLHEATEQVDALQHELRRVQGELAAARSAQATKPEPSSTAGDRADSPGEPPEPSSLSS